MTIKITFVEVESKGVGRGSEKRVNRGPTLKFTVAGKTAFWKSHFYSSSSHVDPSVAVKEQRKVTWPGGTADKQSPAMMEMEGHHGSWVIAASMRRIREIRRKQARDKDKATICWLRCEVARLEMDISSWQEWFSRRQNRDWSWKGQHQQWQWREYGAHDIQEIACDRLDASQVLAGLACRDEAAAESAAAAAGAAAARVSDSSHKCIDYSKWDRLELSSSSCEAGEAEEEDDENEERKHGLRELLGEEDGYSDQLDGERTHTKKKKP